MTTFIRLWLSLIVMVPLAARANEIITAGTNFSSVGSLNWGLICIIIGGLAGGIAATFIATEVDGKLTNHRVAKLMIGMFLSIFTCLSWTAYYPDITMLKLALPSFVLGCLGAPIVVFLLTWASDAKTFNRAGKTLNKRLGLEEESSSTDIEK